MPARRVAGCHEAETAMTRLQHILTRWFGDESETSATIRRHQIDIMVAGTPIISSGNIVNASLAVAVCWQRVDHTLLLTWLGSMWIFGGWRLLRWWRNQARGPYPSVPRRIAIRATVWSALAGILWGVLPLLNFPQQDITHYVFLAFVLGGMVAAGMTWMSPLLPAIIVYAASSMLPLIASMLLLYDSPESKVMGIMLVLYTAAMVYYAQRANRDFIATITAGLERERLVQALEQAQSQLEVRVADRTAELTQANDRLQAEVRERRRAEAALRENEERITEAHATLNDALESSPAALALYDRDDRLITCNSKFGALFGGKMRPVERGTPFSALVEDFADTWLAGENRDEQRRWLESIKAGHASPVGPHQFRLRDGRWLQLTEYRATNGSTASVFTDITLLMEQEEQLRQAQKMEVVGQLTGGIAHDFNNLLSVIVGSLELTEVQSSQQPALHSAVQRALAAARRGGMLTQKLLAFSRKQVLQSRLVDLNELVHGLLDLLQRSLGETVQIRTALSPTPVVTHIDLAQYENALMNLAINARDAMPDGGTLTIGTDIVTVEDATRPPGADVEPGSYAVLTVRDTGTGIAPEVLSNIFEPFFTTKGIGKGSGLGLSMVYGLVKQSGGYIAVQSQAGRGTTVRIYLKRDLTPWPALESRGDGAKPAASRTERILVVEDDPDLRELAVILLTELGYETLDAGDGHAALSLLDAGANVDLLFTDVILPKGMSGPELAQEAQQRHPNLKVLFTSGYTENALGKHGQLEEGIELIHKPYHKVDLSLKLDAILHGAAAAARGSLRKNS